MDTQWVGSTKFGMGTKILILMYFTHLLSCPRYSALSLPQNLKPSEMLKENDSGNDESEAKEFVEMLDRVFTSGMNKEMTARWNYITNITEQNENAQVSYSLNQSFLTNVSNVVGYFTCFIIIIFDQKSFRMPQNWSFKRSKKKLQQTFQASIGEISKMQNLRD